MEKWSYGARSSTMALLIMINSLEISSLRDVQRTWERMKRKYPEKLDP